MMKSAAIAFAVFACQLLSAASVQLTSNGGGRACSTAPTMGFPEFLTKYKRAYAPGSQEYTMREGVFMTSVEKGTRHNCMDVDVDWDSAINHLADWSEEELKGLRGYRSGVKNQHGAGAGSVGLAAGHGRKDRRKPAEIASELPAEASWGNLTAMKVPRDQKGCGSCWAYAAVNVLEASHEIFAGRYQDFSVAQILACTPNPRHCGGSGGCDGATGELAFDYILGSGLGLGSELLEDPEGHAVTCPSEMIMSQVLETQQELHGNGREVHRLGKDYHSNAAAFHSARAGTNMMRGWLRLPSNNYEALKRGLVELGPIAVAVAADQYWNFYSDGVMSAKACDENRVINHAVTAYGYGKHRRKMFWELKNSWGGEWGMKGSLRIERRETEGSDCGWDHHPEQGNACDGGPTKVWVCGTCGVLFDMAAPIYRDPAFM